MNERTADFEVPRSVRLICRILAEHGEVGYVVGGSIRDLLRGRRPADWDIATTALPERVVELFDRVVPTGIDHGTVTVLIAGDQVEVTTLRGEGAYTDGRHPDSVAFIRDIDDDLARRDFTVNAIAWNPASGELHDPSGGRDDLARGLLRAVGDPAERFAEDGLRVLRAARFAATLGLTLAPTTRAAMPAAAATLARVSVERKRDELIKTLLAPAPSVGLALMERTGLLPYVVAPLTPRVEPGGVCDGTADPWLRTLAFVDAVPPRIALRLVALFHTPGSSDPSATADRWLLETRFDKATRRRVTHLLERLAEGYDGGWTDGELRRYLARLGRDAVADLSALLGARVGAFDEPDERRRLAEQLAERLGLAAGDPAVALTTRELALDGRTLMAELGLAPGPRIGALLDRLLEAVLDDPGLNEAGALLERARNLR